MRNLSDQYIHDNKGKATGVFIPIADWKNLKKKYNDLESDQNGFQLLNWHKKLIDERLKDLKENADDNVDFDEMINRVEKLVPLENLLIFP